MVHISNHYEFGPSNHDQEPKSLVILLHGLGSNGRDLISLAPECARFLPDTVFISPDAPLACDMVPPGYPDSYQWFSLQSRDPEAMLSGAEQAYPILERFIKKMMEEYGIASERTALAGFSQGTMMSLYAGPRLPFQIAGVLGYSGALVGGEGLAQDPEEFKRFPVMLIHGEADDVVSVQAYHHARKTLEEASYKVSGYTQSGLAHGIDEKGVRKGADFLSQVLYKDSLAA